MDRYPLVSALSRPVIVKHLVRRRAAARREHRGPRLHRQGQRPGALRGRHRQPRARPHAASRRSATTRMTRDKAIEFAERNNLPIDVRQEVAVLDRPERLGPRRRDRLPRGHLERPDRGRLRVHAEPGRRRARPTRSSSRSRRASPVAIDGRPVTMLQAIQELNQPRRCPGRRPARHGRGPARRHQEPRGVRGSRRDRADHRARGARERHGRARPGPLRARRLAALERAGLRRPVVLAAQARARRLPRRARSSTSPATSG